MYFTVFFFSVSFFDHLVSLISHLFTHSGFFCGHYLSLCGNCVVSFLGSVTFKQEICLFRGSCPGPTWLLSPPGLCLVGQFSIPSKLWWHITAVQYAYIHRVCPSYPIRRPQQSNQWVKHLKWTQSLTFKRIRELHKGHNYCQFIINLTMSSSMQHLYRIRSSEIIIIIIVYLIIHLSILSGI